MQSGSAKPNCERALASARRCGFDGAGAAGAGAGEEEDEEEDDEPLILGEVGAARGGAVASFNMRPKGLFFALQRARALLTSAVRAT
jgi:hypothetical protein